MERALVLELDLADIAFDDADAHDSVFDFLRRHEGQRQRIARVRIHARDLVRARINLRQRNVLPDHRGERPRQRLVGQNRVAVDIDAFQNELDVLGVRRCRLRCPATEPSRSSTAAALSDLSRIRARWFPVAPSFARSLQAWPAAEKLRTAIPRIAARTLRPRTKRFTKSQLCQAAAMRPERAPPICSPKLSAAPTATSLRLPNGALSHVLPQGEISHRVRSELQSIGGCARKLLRRRCANDTQQLS